MTRILLAFLFALASGGAMAETVHVEPDAMPDGADLTYAYPGVVLTVDGEPDRVVRAAVGFSVFNGRNLATTGTLVCVVTTEFTVFRAREGVDPRIIWLLLRSPVARADILLMSTGIARTRIRWEDVKRWNWRLSRNSASLSPPAVM